MLEYAMAMFFSFDYLLRLFMADHKLRYIVSLLALVDLVTIVPVLAELAGRGQFAKSKVVQVSDSAAPLAARHATHRGC